MPNRLIQEKSPYLLQHAQNPVDWYPWGDEAREAAHRENKPIFLSVGYSTCHWCHVMEHESFENETIAALLNRYFIPVKVDREERPDVDRVYMAYVQAATGSGGWPMSVWLTPDGRPFVGGTYFPPDNRYGRPGFAAVLERIAAAWTNERGRIEESSESVLQELFRQATVEPAAGDLDPSVLDSGFAVWRRSFDARLGGFGHAPKFPRPAIFKFLLRYWARTRNEEALEMVDHTLRAMSRGGMNDQLGGGFHRYSVDEYWFVPHFEKMLYDQAQLASSFVDMFQITKDETFALEARRIFDYVARDMTSPEGAFYSAEDADSVIDPSDPKHKGEGAFYIWTADEIQTIAGEDARFFNHRYGVKTQGNVENDPHAEFTGRNILYEHYSVEETAHHFDQPLEHVRAAIERASAKLSQARSTRVRPHLDDKVLASWNGLMISAFAQAGAVLDDQQYAGFARGAAGFVREHMWNASTGILLRRYRDGEFAIPGFLDDYAFFAQALLDLYEAEFDPADLELAVEITRHMRVRFEDPDAGGFFTTVATGPDSDVLFRMKDDYDGAEPSGNSVAAMNLLRLERLTSATESGDAGRRILKAFSGRMSTQPFGVPLTMCALDFSLSKPLQIVLAGERNAPETQEMLRAIRGIYQPNRAVLLASSEPLGEAHAGLSEMRSVNGHTAAYVCENFTCQLPVTEVPELLKLLQ